MELIPLIKLTLVIFTIGVTLIIGVSYIIYKIRGNRKQVSSAEIKVQKHAFSNGQNALAVQPVLNDVSSHTHRRQTEIKRIRKQSPIERFKVINNQQQQVKRYDYKDFGLRAFYQPRVQTAAVGGQVLNQMASNFNIFDRYSNGNERLHKLNANSHIS